MESNNIPYVFCAYCPVFKHNQKYTSKLSCTKSMCEIASDNQKEVEYTY